MMNKITSIQTAPIAKLKLGMLEQAQPNKPIGVVFSVDLPETDLYESWEGVVGVHRGSLVELINWMHNQYQAFQGGKKLGKINLNGIPILAELRGPQHGRAIWLKIEARNLPKVAKLIHEGNPTQWPDWLMPIDKAYNTIAEALNNPPGLLHLPAGR